MATPKADRLTAAAEIRRRVHAFFRAHPGEQMGALATAIPERTQSSLASTVRGMLDAGHLRCEGRYAWTRYYAVGSEVESADAVRDRVRAGARKSNAILRGRPQPPEPPPAPAGRPVDPPWLTRNQSAHKRAIQNQGGQGAGGCWRGGASSLVATR